MRGSGGPALQLNEWTAKHFGFEPPKLRALLPCVSRQAGLVARLLDKRLRIPTPLNGNLGQQQSSMTAHFHDQAVPADHDVVG